MLRIKQVYSTGFSGQFIPIIGVLMFITIACNAVSDNDNEASIPVPFEVLGARSMNSTSVDLCWLNTSNLDMNHSENGLSAIELAITSRADFETYILCDEPIEAPDFEERFILAGLSTLQPQCVYVGEQDVYMSQGKLVYKVTIGDMDCHMPDRAQYIVMIPNDYQNLPVNFLILKEE